MRSLFDLNDKHSVAVLQSHRHCLWLCRIWELEQLLMGGLPQDYRMVLAMIINFATTEDSSVMI
jgi:hypothetical protein